MRVGINEKVNVHRWPASGVFKTPHKFYRQYEISKGSTRKKMPGGGGRGVSLQYSDPSTNDYIFQKDLT